LWVNMPRRESSWWWWRWQKSYVKMRRKKMGLLNKNGVWQHILTIFFLWRFHVGLHTKAAEKQWAECWGGSRQKFSSHELST
jgi:hypothetical protein